MFAGNRLSAGTAGTPDLCPERSRLPLAVKPHVKIVARVVVVCAEDVQELCHDSPGGDPAQGGENRASPVL